MLIFFVLVIYSFNISLRILATYTTRATCRALPTRFPWVARADSTTCSTIGIGGSMGRTKFKRTIAPTERSTSISGDAKSTFIFIYKRKKK
jgi:hypothetical protein